MTSCIPFWAGDGQPAASSSDRSRQNNSNDVDISPQKLTRWRYAVMDSKRSRGHEAFVSTWLRHVTALVALSLSTTTMGCKAALPHIVDGKFDFDQTTDPFKPRLGSIAMPTPTTPLQADSESTNMTPPPGHGPYTGTVADWPLWFIAHSFGVSTYSTYGCKVRYGNYRIDEADDELQSSSEALGSKYPDNMSAGWGPIPNFPPPAIVTWRSKDGIPHTAEIDIGEIFRDKLIRHTVARGDIPEGISIGSTGIILEVNDRTINVYTRTFIPLKSPRLPGRPNSDYRDEVMKVFSHTY
jgi:hypothetical protein